MLIYLHAAFLGGRDANRRVLLLYGEAVGWVQDHLRDVRIR
jgi:hypothetical protein